MASRKKWSPITRGIYFEPTMVCARLRFYAKQYEALGNERESHHLDLAAYEVERGTLSVRDAAELVIRCTEDPELNDDTILDTEEICYDYKW